MQKSENSKCLWHKLSVLVILAGLTFFLNACASSGKKQVVVRGGNHTTVVAPGETVTVTATNGFLFIMDECGLLLKLGLDCEE